MFIFNLCMLLKMFYPFLQSVFYTKTFSNADLVERERERESSSTSSETSLKMYQKTQRPLSKCIKVQNSLTENIRKFASKGTKQTGKRGADDVCITCKTAALVLALPFWLDMMIH